MESGKWGKVARSSVVKVVEGGEVAKRYGSLKGTVESSGSQVFKWNKIIL